jgi:hypothetical protein
MLSMGKITVSTAFVCNPVTIWILSAKAKKRRFKATPIMFPVINIIALVDRFPFSWENIVIKKKFKSRVSATDS